MFVKLTKRREQLLVDLDRTEPQFPSHVLDMPALYAKQAIDFARHQWKRCESVEKSLGSKAPLRGHCKQPGSHPTAARVDAKLRFIVQLYSFMVTPERPKIVFDVGS